MPKKEIWRNRYQSFRNEGEDWQLVNHSVAGVVTVVTTVGGALLLNHERLGKISLEMPRGYVEKGETSEISAKRECLEELGISDADISYTRLLGLGNPDNSYINQTIYYQDVELGKRESIQIENLQLSEGIRDVKWYSWKEIHEMVATGKITDSYTLSALAFLFA